jgi:hypothetical protein
MWNGEIRPALASATSSAFDKALAPLLRAGVLLVATPQDKESRAMTPSDITNAVSLLAALSVATERLVEIIKGSIPWLNNSNANTTEEGWRQACLHVLAFLSGIFTAYMAGSAIEGIVPKSLNTVGGYIVIGLLASGGSGFWNSILSYLQSAKDVKASQASAVAPAGSAAA